MEILLIILVCFVVAVVVGTGVAMARKQKALDAQAPPDEPGALGGGVLWVTKAEGVSGVATDEAPTEPPGREPPEPVL